MQIRSLIFLKLYPKIVKNAYLRIPIFKISRGSMPPDPLQGARAGPRRDRVAITSFGVLEFHAPPWLKSWIRHWNTWLKRRYQSVMPVSMYQGTSIIQAQRPSGEENGVTKRECSHYDRPKQLASTVCSYTPYQRHVCFQPLCQVSHHGDLSTLAWHGVCPTSVEHPGWA